MIDRRVDGFFYGLYMDLDVLREAGVPGLEHYRPEAVLAHPLGVPRRRLSATTCARRRGPRSAIRLTPSVCGAR